MDPVDAGALNGGRICSGRDGWRRRGFGEQHFARGWLGEVCALGAAAVSVAETLKHPFHDGIVFGVGEIHEFDEMVCPVAEAVPWGGSEGVVACEFDVGRVGSVEDLDLFRKFEGPRPAHTDLLRIDPSRVDDEVRIFWVGVRVEEGELVRGDHMGDPEPVRLDACLFHLTRGELDGAAFGMEEPSIADGLVGVQDPFFAVGGACFMDLDGGLVPEKAPRFTLGRLLARVSGSVLHCEVWGGECGDLNREEKRPWKTESHLAERGGGAFGISSWISVRAHRP